MSGFAQDERRMEMRTIAEYNPFAVTVYFLAVAGTTMFSMNPVILVLSLAGALSYFFVRNGFREMKSHLAFFLMFLFMALLNPLISHNGVTVLFVMNNNPVTLEALVYGIAAAAMILAVLYWFRSYSQIMTSDKLLYVFGVLSPRLALILSMAIRYVPLFGSQVKKVNQAQKALGLYKEDNLVDSFRGGVRVFSVMVTRALENGIITADSMTARGYGSGKRSHYSTFCFRRGDWILMGISCVLLIVTWIGLGDFTFNYYPALKVSALQKTGLIGCISYGLLAFLPVIIEEKETLKWNCLQSKI